MLSINLHHSTTKPETTHLYLHVLLGFDSLSKNHKASHFPKHTLPLAVAQGLELRALMHSHSGIQASLFNSLSSPDCCGGTTYSSDFARLDFTG